MADPSTFHRAHDERAGPDEDREGKKDKEKKKDKQKPLGSDRGIETMFRTSYRMHTDMSALADSKANIMISINGLMVSIILGTVSAKIAVNEWLLLPTFVLLVTCALSLSFAVLAARPRVRKGAANDPSQTNLMFFGSFVSLSPAEYQQGVEGLMREPTRLYQSMAQDIYGLGKVLERKFELLRIAYTIFLFGLIAGIVLYLAVYVWIVVSGSAAAAPSVV
ncbi:MAG TPA: Pycsar system effector family protein [Longimicrobiaceae bacterium]|nr:Pycsar system effector family protein [Longimicrobiaceae bacterium]